MTVSVTVDERPRPLCANTRPECRALDHLSALDDGEEALLGPGDQGDVGDRVAVDEDQVGDGSLFHDAEPSGVGIPRPGEGKQLGVREEFLVAVQLRGGLLGAVESGGERRAKRTQVLRLARKLRQLPGQAQARSRLSFSS